MMLPARQQRFWFGKGSNSSYLTAKMSLSNMRIGARLGLSFGVFLPLLCSVAFIGIARLNAMNDAIVAAIDFNANENNLISQTLGNASEAATAMRNLIILNDVPRMTIQRKAYDENIASYRENEKKLNDLFSQNPGTTSEEQNFLQKMKAIRDEAMPWVDKAAQLGLKSDPSAPEVMMTETAPALDRWIGLMVEFRDYEIKASNEAAADAHSAYDRSVKLMYVLSGIGVIIGVIVAWLATRSTIVPTRQAVGVAETVASRDLTSRIEVDRRDEVGQLLQALKRMNSSLMDVVSGIRITTKSVTMASQEIASGNTDLSARTEKQAASLEETAASMTQLTETVKHNADKARQANALATHATNVAAAGNDAVQGMVQTIGEIGGSSPKISEITGTIEGIAFQTNILALNAAVEAAHAGEQGRGFAVVASEVRGLAQRSAAAAKEIKEPISSSVTMIQDGAKQATEVGATMGEVKQAIKQVSDIVGEIAAASDEQRRGIEQVNQAAGQMDEVAQQNAALVEQAAAAAHSLEEQANNLKQAVSVFKLADMEALPKQAALPQSRSLLPVQNKPVAQATRKLEQLTVSPTRAARASKTAANSRDESKDVWETF
jgi:methyl-accepting chemotaxis protein